VAVVDPQVDEGGVLAALLKAHLAYRPGGGARAALLREYAAVAPEQLVVLLRKEQCPVSAKEQGSGGCDGLRHASGQLLCSRHRLHCVAFLLRWALTCTLLPGRPMRPVGTVSTRQPAWAQR
jgi:hypothetical protein